MLPAALSPGSLCSRGATVCRASGAFRMSRTTGQPAQKNRDLLLILEPTGRHTIVDGCAPKAAISGGQMIRLASPKSEVEFEVVEPWDPRVDVFALEDLG